MDKTTLVISIISMMICAVPFLFVVKARNRRKKELLNELKYAAEKHDSDITHYEIHGDIALAMDSKKGYFHFLNPESGKSKVTTLDLIDFTQCAVEKEFDDARSSRLKRVAIRFTGTASGKKDRSLVFYDIETNYQPSGEIQLAEKWAGILNEVMSGSLHIASKLDQKVV